MLWNEAMVALDGTPTEEAIGHPNISEPFYADGRRTETLADKILKHPESAHEHYDVELEDPASYRYRDTSTSVDDITALDDRMDDIEEIVEVISDVAEQTNLLALNANIEAARASSDGHAFTVVAEEVTASLENGRHLSDRTESAVDRVSEVADEQTDAIDGLLSHVDDLRDGMAED